VERSYISFPSLWQKYRQLKIDYDRGKDNYEEATVIMKKDKDHYEKVKMKSIIKIKFERSNYEKVKRNYEKVIENIEEEIAVDDAAVERSSVDDAAVERSYIRFSSLWQKWRQLKIDYDRGKDNYEEATVIMKKDKDHYEKVKMKSIIKIKFIDHIIDNIEIMRK